MLAAIALLVAIEPPAPAATPPATSEPTPEYQPGWDEPQPEPPPPTETTTAPPPTVSEPLPATPPATPPPQPTNDARTERHEGRGLLIGAGVAAGIGLVANSMRVYIVNVPCQTDSQQGCSGSWALSTAFAWGPNLASIALAGVGGDLRGRYAATYDPEGHRRRSRGMTAAGAVLLGTGALANILLRVGWFSDWVSPQGREFFDFARTGEAIAYYGGLQLSSMAMATGIGMLSYGGARPRKPKVAIMPMGMGMQLRGRF
ncbi:MAG TPA: hypothetical protein VG755_02410 [Nannocystaceae bacterium]|nr:hypothetical protein [Nannocystaceae bacterium]